MIHAVNVNVAVFQGGLLGKFLKQRKNLKEVETKKHDRDR